MEQIFYIIKKITAIKTICVNLWVGKTDDKRTAMIYGQNVSRQIMIFYFRFYCFEVGQNKLKFIFGNRFYEWNYCVNCVKGNKSLKIVFTGSCFTSTLRQMFNYHFFLPTAVPTPSAWMFLAFDCEFSNSIQTCFRLITFTLFYNFLTWFSLNYSTVFYQ